MNPTGPLLVEIAAGELFDKITILQIKSQRLTDAGKLANVRAELAHLVSVRDSRIGPDEEVSTLVEQLRSVNETLWDIEDALRTKEKQKAFDEQFIDLARAVYINNDERSRIKSRISKRFGCPFVEVKSYD